MDLQKSEIANFLKEIRNAGLDIQLLSTEKSTPYVGRTPLFEETLTRLFCAYQKSLLIVGQAGVGKTSFVCELACKMSTSSHKLIRNQVIFEISVGSLLAGTNLRGEFEKKVIFLLNYTKTYENVILFLDEAHMMADTASEGGMSMLNLLKPFIIAQNIRFILATTDLEVDKLQKDAAFFRRFHQIHLPPLTTSERLAAIQEHFHYLSQYHGVDTIVDLKEIIATRPLHSAINELDFFLAQERFNAFR